MIDYSGETAKYLPLMMNGFYLVRLGWIISNQKKSRLESFASENFS